MDMSGTTRWPGLTNHDAYWCQRRLPDLVRVLLKDKEVRLALAGGYLRSCIANEPINDIDLFSTSREVASLAATKIAGGQKVHKTDNAFSVRLPCGMSVQFIHRWTFARPEQIIPSFDFTIARVAMWWEPSEGESNLGRWRTLCDPRFYPDLAAKRLVYCSPIRNEDAGGSLLRVLKFYQRGYRIPLESLGAVIGRLAMALDMDRIDTAVRDGANREAEISRVLTGLLREVDPAMDPTHLAHCPGADDVTEESDVSDT